MESFARVFPLDWTTLEYVLAIFGVDRRGARPMAFLAHRALRKDRAKIGLTAEQVAIAIAGKMASHSQEEGDSFSLKESNSIRSSDRRSRARPRCGEHEAGAPRHRQAQIRGQRARHRASSPRLRGNKRAEAERAAARPPRRFAIKARSSLPTGRGGGAAICSSRPSSSIPTNPENLLALALVQFRLGDIPSVEALIETARGGDGQARREDIAA